MIAFKIHFSYTRPMTIIWHIGLALSLFLAAAFAALLGIGGGVLYTPLQVLYGVDIYTAAATSLFLIIILSLSATRVYRKANKVDWQLAFVLEIFSICGGFAGGFFSDLVPALTLKIILVVTLIIAAVFMFLKDTAAIKIGTGSEKIYVWKRERNGISYDVNLLIALPIALIAGILSGMLGIGGGVLKVPMMTLLLGIPMDIAISTSVFMVGITSLAGFSGHLLAGHWNWKMSLILAPFVFVGAYIGAHTMLRTDKKKLKFLFGVFLILIAAGLVYTMVS